MQPGCIASTELHSKTLYWLTVFIAGTYLDQTLLCWFRVLLALISPFNCKFDFSSSSYWWDEGKRQSTASNFESRKPLTNFLTSPYRFHFIFHLKALQCEMKRIFQNRWDLCVTFSFFRVTFTLFQIFDKWMSCRDWEFSDVEVQMQRRELLCVSLHSVKTRDLHESLPRNHLCTYFGSD